MPWEDEPNPDDKWLYGKGFIIFVTIIFIICVGAAILGYVTKE